MSLVPGLARQHVSLDPFERVLAFSEENAIEPLLQITHAVARVFESVTQVGDELGELTDDARPLVAGDTAQYTRMRVVHIGYVVRADKDRPESMVVHLVRQKKGDKRAS